jgi:hypothetical protein
MNQTPQNSNGDETDLTKSVLNSPGMIRRSMWLRCGIDPKIIMSILIVLGLGAYSTPLWLPNLPRTQAPVLNAARIKLTKPEPSQADLHGCALSDYGAKVLAAVCASGIFLVGYFQWHAARREQSLERFYDRIKEATQPISDYEMERWKNDPLERKIHLLNMRVFFQLDNLEYILEKYRRGYVDWDVVDRAVRTFRAECKDKSFTMRLLDWIGRTDEEQQAEGTPKYVRSAARLIALRFESAFRWVSIEEGTEGSPPLRVEITDGAVPRPAGAAVDA